jgi:osmotically-inducible protein OsmY
MRRQRHAWLLLGLILSGCQNQDAPQLAKLGARLSEKAQAFLIGSSHRLGQSWPSLPIQFGEAALDARVSARLHWDSKLAELGIRVKADGGTVELQGKVQDAEQRRRAVQLAETTVGVEQVTDKLEGPE